VLLWLYWLSGNILIDRKDSGRAKDTLLQTVAKINQRRLSVFFFPEGTRSYGRGLLPFKTGAFRIALAAKEPIVTVSASSLHNKVKLNRWNNGTVLIDLSEPESIDSDSNSKQLAKHFHGKMQSKIQQLDAEVAVIDQLET
jgi:1-acyl-sn-glycerol-3-phosphate acyltransferase